MDIKCRANAQQLRLCLCYLSVIRRSASTGTLEGLSCMRSCWMSIDGAFTFDYTGMNAESLRINHSVLSFSFILGCYQCKRKHEGKRYATSGNDLRAYYMESASWYHINTSTPRTSMYVSTIELMSSVYLIAMKDGHHHHDMLSIFH